jgi:hypothetical protein
MVHSFLRCFEVVLKVGFKDVAVDSDVGHLPCVCARQQIWMDEKSEDS